MKKCSRTAPAKIKLILKEIKSNDLPIKSAAKKCRVCVATIYNWKKKYARKKRA